MLEEAGYDQPLFPPHQPGPSRVWWSHRLMFRGRPAWNIRFSMTQPGLCPTYNHLAPSACVEALSGTKTLLQVQLPSNPLS